MTRVAVITDTVANLPEAVYRRYGVRVVPQIVIFGETSYREGIDLTLEEFYRRLALADPLPITSRPTPQSYLEAFEDASREAEEVVVLTPSARLSGAYDAAMTAAREWGGRATIVDTKTASIAQGFLVLEAARFASAGASAAEVEARVRQLRPRVAMYAAVHTLRYLQRTGRVGRAAAAVGSLLQIKPIITIGQDGVVDTADRVRSWGRALERLVELIASERPAMSGGRLHVGVMHAEAREDGQAVLERIEERFPIVERYFGYFTPAVATHTGPGLVGVSYWWET